MCACAHAMVLKFTSVQPLLCYKAHQSQLYMYQHEYSSIPHQVCLLMHRPGERKKGEAIRPRERKGRRFSRTPRRCPLPRPRGASGAWAPPPSARRRSWSSRPSPGWPPPRARPHVEIRAFVDIVRLLGLGRSDLRRRDARLEEILDDSKQLLDFPPICSTNLFCFVLRVAQLRG